MLESLKNYCSISTTSLITITLGVSLIFIMYQCYKLNKLNNLCHRNYVHFEHKIYNLSQRQTKLYQKMTTQLKNSTTPQTKLLSHTLSSQQPNITKPPQPPQPTVRTFKQEEDDMGVIPMTTFIFSSASQHPKIQSQYKNQEPKIIEEIYSESEDELTTEDKLDLELKDELEELK